MKVNAGGKRKAGAEGGISAQNGAPDDLYDSSGKLGEASDAGDNYQSLDADNLQNQEETQERGNEEESEDDEENEAENEQEEAAQEERPKLDEGFFEIEAIRRRRVRKGRLQYLIKWRGWPETANTWEPLENLQSISDVIEAFEESLRSGKSSRKRKRKSGGPQSLPKRKQSRSSNLTDVAGPSNLASIENRGESSRDAAEKGHSNGPIQINTTNEETEYDPKISELKGAVPTNEVNAHDKLKEANVSEPAIAKKDSADAAQGDRCVGARRRKCGSVKRFKQDFAAANLAVSQGSSQNLPFGYAGGDGQLGVGDFGQKNMNGDSRNVPTIVKILKPIDFSTFVRDNIQDVAVTFMALRSDGKEVLVDNTFLKANDPMLLINFYEQHLKYSAP